MNDDSVESIFEEFKLSSPPFTLDPTNGDVANATGCYARNLRVLGQLFEGFSLSSLHVAVFNRCYTVRGLKTSDKPTPKPIMKHLWSRLGDVGKVAQVKTSGNLVKCEFTEEDLKVADALYKKFRQDSSVVHVKNRISEIFRGIGYFIDIQEKATLKCFSFGQKYISIDYLTADGELKHVEKRTDDFYDLWLKMSPRVAPTLNEAPM